MTDMKSVTEVMEAIEKAPAPNPIDFWMSWGFTREEAEKVQAEIPMTNPVWEKVRYS